MSAKRAEIAIALYEAHEKSYLFEYLDWCKSQGMAYEQTLERDAAMRFGRELHRKGIDLNGLQLAELYESLEGGSKP